MYELVLQSQSAIHQLPPGDYGSETLKWKAGVSLQWDESRVEGALSHLCHCLCSQSDFIDQVRKYLGLIAKQRLSLKLVRGLDSKPSYVLLTQRMLFFFQKDPDIWHSRAMYMEQLCCRILVTSHFLALWRTSLKSFGELMCCCGILF